MPSSGRRHIEVAFTPEFKRNIRRLARKYPDIRSDIDPVIGQLEMGETPGDQIPGVGYTLYKVRIQNSSSKKGKRSGYRMIYYLARQESVILVTIYSKSEQGDVSVKKLQEIIAELE